LKDKEFTYTTAERQRETRKPLNKARTLHKDNRTPTWCLGTGLITQI